MPVKRPAAVAIILAACLAVLLAALIILNRGVGGRLDDGPDTIVITGPDMTDPDTAPPDESPDTPADEEALEPGDTTYELSEDGTLTISGTGAMEDYYFSSNDTDNPPPWYDVRSSITRVVIKEGVTRIGSTAFRGYDRLTSVTIPRSVKHIGEAAFYGCSGLKSVTIPDSVTAIGNWAFGSCTGLKSVKIPNGLTSIGNGAFSGCSGLKSITIPGSVTSIGWGVFGSCTGLTSVTILNSVTLIENSTFSGCTGLKSVTIPNSVIIIGPGAFSDCSSLTSIKIPNRVTTIENNAFKGCASLMSIEVAADNPHYSSEDGVLFNKDKTKLILYPQGRQGASYTIPAGVASIFNYAFEDCAGLTSITVEEGNASYSSEDGVLFNKNKTGLILYPQGKQGASYTIPAGVDSIRQSAFDGSAGLTSITVAEDNAGYSSEDGVLFNKDKTKLILYPQGRQGASYTIPAGVDSIRQSAFDGSAGLTSVTIPGSVISVGWMAFYGCTGLTSIIARNPKPPIASPNAFYGIKLNNACLYAPATGIDAYRAAEEWKEFKCIKDLESAPEGE